MPPTLQGIVRALDDFWSARGCALTLPYNSEVGAGTFNPNTFFRALGPAPWRCAYVEISRRPRDGRYAENPNRVQQFHQYQVLLKPPPDDVQSLYVASLAALGIEPLAHDLRFVEDDWGSPTLGAWGLGWEVWLDCLEITQFTYFQQIGGVDCDPPSCEITYGLERIATFVQGVESIFDVEWAPGLKWGELFERSEREFSKYNFETAPVGVLRRRFGELEREAVALIEEGLVLPAFDAAVKCSHVFNLLDARGGLATSARDRYIARVRALTAACARAYLDDTAAAP